MRAVVFAAVLALCGSTVMAQVSTEEAMKRLQEKQAARDSSRSKPVTITQGELDDMRAEILRLKAELAQLRSSQPSNDTKPSKMPTAIVVGMTRDDLMRYISLHKDRYTLTAANPVVQPPQIAGAPPQPSGETIRIATKAMREVIVGVSSNGVNRFADTHKELRPDSNITLNMLDNKVSSIQEDKLPPSADEATPENIQRATAGIAPGSKRRGR